jgi:hypothetical protein
MKNLLKSVIFLPLLILLTACPYESVVPIKEAKSAIDDRLLGKWYKDGEMDKEYPDEFYRIKKEGDSLYQIIKKELNSEDNTYKEEIYISHITELQDSEGKKYKFLNMKKDDKYYLHRIRLNKERFVLYEVTDNIDEQFDNSDELRKFVKENMHLSFFYNKDEVTYYKGDHTKE